MKVAVTICSKDKKQDSDLLPATERYLSARIGIVQEIARKEGLPLYIFSAKFGVLSGDTPIPWYEKQLTKDDIAEIVPKITEQIREAGITEIDFYGKDKSTEGWTAYHEALEQAVRKLGIPFRTHTISY